MPSSASCAAVAAAAAAVSAYGLGCQSDVADVITTVVGPFVVNAQTWPAEFHGCWVPASSGKAVFGELLESPAR